MGVRALPFINQCPNTVLRYRLKRRFPSHRCGNRKAALPHHQLIGLSQILCGDGRIQAPGDVHRLAALVLYIVRGSEIGIGRSRIADAIRLEFADKEQNTAAARLVVDVTLPGRRLLSRGALALPVEKCLVNRVVVVHGGRRIVLIRLIEGHKEDIQLLLRKPFDTFADSCGHRRTSVYYPAKSVRQSDFLS